MTNSADQLLAALTRFSDDENFGSGNKLSRCTVHQFAGGAIPMIAAAAGGSAHAATSGKMAITR